MEDSALGAALADVSGKGAGAALLIAHLQAGQSSAILLTASSAVERLKARECQ